MNEIDAMLQKKTSPAPQENEAYEINLMNRLTNGKDPVPVPVYAGNTLGQIALGYGDRIGLKTEKNKFKFYNEKTTPVRSTVEMNMTLEKFGIGPGDTLSITDEGSVAAM